MADLASDPLAWRSVKAPSLAALEVLAGEVFRALPKGFRDLCADLVIQVDDFPSEEVLTEMQAETEFDLLGLFQGIGLPFRSESAAVQMPNMIWLYRRPILDYWAEHDERCRFAIAPIARRPRARRFVSRSRFPAPPSR
jgi:predicted Zn-dependent protease with MMP-like domain